MKQLKSLFFFPMLLFCYFGMGVSILSGQEKTDSSNTTIIIDNADNTIVEKEEDSYVKYLNGNVRVIHDGSFFYCDTAEIRDNDLFAFGNVVILQKDTTTLFSDSLFYNADSMKAILSGRVLLQHQGKELKTQVLEYDVENKLAYYDVGGQLKQDSTTLTSLRCLYDINENMVYFNDFVTIEDSSFQLKADSIHYLTSKKISYFTGPTLITQDSAQIYCEDGFYDIENGNAEFLQKASFVEGKTKASAIKINYFDDENRYILAGNARYSDEELDAKADTIQYLKNKELAILMGHVLVLTEDGEVRGEKIWYYLDSGNFVSDGRTTFSEDELIISANEMDFDEEKGIGFAFGNIVMEDTLSRTTIFSDYLMSVDSTNSFTTWCDSLTRPLMEKVMDQDTMFLSADTLWSYEVYTEMDSFQVLHAYHDVRIFHRDFQGIGDSMLYHTRDSVFHLMSAPVLWSDSTQFSGDTISIFLQNEKIDRIFLRKNGLIVSDQGASLYNQIGGKEIDVFFENDSLRLMHTVGNAESIFYMKDDLDAFMGAIKTVCSSMDFYFRDNDMTDIKYYKDPVSKMTPIKKEIMSPQRLKSFFWREEERPLDNNIRKREIKYSLIPDNELPEELPEEIKIKKDNIKEKKESSDEK